MGYDQLGQLIEETIIRPQHPYKTQIGGYVKTTPSTQTLTHEYDALGNRVKTTLPDGKQLNQLYYGSGHLYNQSLTDTNGKTTEIRHSQTDELHQEVSRIQGKLDSQFEYDPMGRLTRQHNQAIERHYGYDKIGQLTHIAGQTRVTAETNYRRHHEYQYDKTGRLTQHEMVDFANTQPWQDKQTSTTEVFAFDPASNRVPVQTQSQEDKKETPKGRLSKLTTHDKELGYRYDKHGRIEYKTQTPLGKDGKAIKQSSLDQDFVMAYLKTVEHVYNANNELEKTVLLEQRGFEIITTTTQYQYDAFGRRVAKTSKVQHKSRVNPRNTRSLPFHRAYQSEKTKQQTTLFLWDGNRQIQEYKDGLVFTTVYEQNSFEPVARVVWNKVADESENEELKVYHYHNDHLGTPNELTDEDGNVVWLADYSAWGNISEICKDFRYQKQTINGVEIDEVDLQPIRFQGQFIDVETGHHYNRFRYYDPELGMFISRDPIGLLGGNNVFAYAPNPVMWIDPWGLSRFSKTQWQAPQNGTNNNYTVYQQPIDWDRIDDKGRTNLERTALGRAPLGTDGRPLNLHHSKQDSRGSLFELTASTHSKYGYTNALHPYKVDRTGQHPFYPVDRDAFDKDRERYWKDRSKAERNRRLMEAKNKC